MKQRNVTIDVARGLAMIAIIAGHLPSPAIWRVVFTFHVPIFFLITGYFSKEGREFGPFIWHKARTLLVPYYLVCLVIIVLATLQAAFLTGADAAGTALHWLIASLYAEGSPMAFPDQIGSIGAIWFLWATFWGELFLWVTLKARGAARPFVAVAIFLAGYLTKDLFWLPLSIQAGAVAALFMYFGYGWRRLKDRMGAASGELHAAAVLFSLIVWAAFIRDFQGFWLNIADVGRGPVDIFGSLCACYGFVWICGLIARHAKHLSAGLAYLGQYSIMLLSVHIVELSLVDWSFITDPCLSLPHPVQLLVLLVAKLCVDVPITLALTRINPVRRAFGMKLLEPSGHKA